MRTAGNVNDDELTPPAPPAPPANMTRVLADEATMRSQEAAAELDDDKTPQLCWGELERPPRATSPFWNHFLSYRNKKQFAKCQIPGCGALVKLSDSLSSGHLKQHLQKRHRDYYASCLGKAADDKLVEQEKEAAKNKSQKSMASYGTQNVRKMSIVRKGTENVRMSKIVEHNGTIYLCGQVAKDATAGIKEQTATTIEKVEDLLKEAGSDKEHMLSVTVYIRDMSDFAAMNEVWDAWVVQGSQPARACVEARMARPELLVEMTVTAAKIV